MAGSCDEHNRLKRKMSSDSTEDAEEKPRWIDPTHIQFGEILTRGSYGFVLAMHFKCRYLVAVKEVKIPLGFEYESFSKLPEYECMSRLREEKHPNILKLYGGTSVDVATGEGFLKRRHTFLITEYSYCDLRGLLDYCHLNEQHAKTIVRSLLRGIYAMHQLTPSRESPNLQHILHRNLKPENILITMNGVVKISGFGHGLRVGLQDRVALRATELGSLHYRAPELILGVERYGKEIDMWSGGCIIGELFAGRVIFDEKDELDQLLKIRDVCGKFSNETLPGVEGSPRWPEFKSKLELSRRHSDVFKRSLKNQLSNVTSGIDLTQKILRLDPKERLSAEQALNHYWLQRRQNDPSERQECDMLRELAYTLDENEHRYSGNPEPTDKLDDIENFVLTTMNIDEVTKILYAPEDTVEMEDSGISTSSASPESLAMKRINRA